MSQKAIFYFVYKHICSLHLTHKFNQFYTLENSESAVLLWPGFGKMVFMVQLDDFGV